jgi:hypothetical protein
MALQCSICTREPEQETGWCIFHPTAALEPVDSETTTASAPAYEIRIGEFEAPAHWASAFVNGDTSGLDEDDCQAFEAWNDANDNPYVVDCSEPFIGRFDGLQTELCTYSFHVVVGSK